MVCLDTSAVLAIALSQKRGADCLAAIGAASEVSMSAATLAECQVVALRRDVLPTVERLLYAMPLEVVPVSGDTAVRVRQVYARWGKGMHPAKLNLFDCFAYVLAKDRQLPLLFIGRDFSKTDIQSALANPDPDA